MRNSPKRRETKRKEILDDLQEVHDHMVHITPIEVSIKKITEALMFILEDTACKKAKQ